VRQSDESAIEELFTTFRPGVRWLLLRKLGPADLDDSVHVCLLATLEALQRNGIENPEKLPSYIRTVVERHAIGRYEDNARRRNTASIEEAHPVQFPSKEADPEELAIQAERSRIAALVLLSLSQRDREVLRRFYLLGHSEAEIRRDLNLTYNQFRLVKSRAKARYAERCRERLNSRRIPPASQTGSKARQAIA
jgi:RNA polymerase sigma factor (sigma-70 family)